MFSSSLNTAPDETNIDTADGATLAGEKLRKKRDVKEEDTPELYEKLAVTGVSRLAAESEQTTAERARRAGGG